MSFTDLHPGPPYLHPGLPRPRQFPVVKQRLTTLNQVFRVTAKRRAGGGAV
jgi:hypothetical protein